MFDFDVRDRGKGELEAWRLRWARQARIVRELGEDGIDEAAAEPIDQRAPEPDDQRAPALDDLDTDR